MHWRGPNADGTANAKPPVKWDLKTNITWKVPIEGKGSGSPIILGDKVFVVTAVPTKQNDESAAPQSSPPQRSRRGGRGGGRGVQPVEMNFKLICFNLKTGEREWEKVAATKTPKNGAHPDNNFASASPCTDGKQIYAHFGSQGLYCFSLDGELKWSRDDFEPMTTRGSFGEGSSPTLADDKIIVPYDHEGDSFLYAFNKATGETVWKISREEPTNWATPLIVEHAGKKQIVMNGQTNARSYDLETGEELWRSSGQTQRPCATPVQFEDTVIVTSGYRGSYMGAFKLGGSGRLDGTESVVWELNRDTPDVASPVLSENRLYFYKAKDGILSCYNAKTGKPFYTATRVPGLQRIYASPIVANGYVYLTDRNGKTVVIKDAETFDVVASNSVGETVDATPAPVDNKLLIRGEKHLFCIAAKE